MGGSFFHYQLAYGHASGKEDIIEPFFQKRAVLCSAALHYRYIFRREDILNQGPDGDGSLGGIGRGLCDTAVACRHCADQGLHGKQKRIVPWGHHQHASVGFP